MSRIYVASLGAYNSGHLLGEWVDIDGMDGDEIREAISAVIAKYPQYGDEWAIHDYELDGISISENPDLDQLALNVEMLGKYGDAWTAYVNNIGEEYADEDGFNEAYIGQFDSLTAWAEDFLEQTGELNEIPERLRYYFDYEAYGRDAHLGGDIWHDSKTGHTFWNS